MARDDTLVTYWQRLGNQELGGWYCWVYPGKDIDFPSWMKQNMSGKFECTHRYNSGDPMFTVWINSDEDATLFKLTWL